jgi:hypothetical protein
MSIFAQVGCCRAPLLDNSGQKIDFCDRGRRLIRVLASPIFAAASAGRRLDVFPALSGNRWARAEIERAVATGRTEG